LLELLNDLRSTTKSTEKKEILKEYIKQQSVVKILHAALDPFITYGIVKLPTIKEGKGQLDVASLDEYLNILDRLANRTLTGNNARNELRDFIRRYDKQSQDILKCILKKDLKCGVSISTSNKVLSDKQQITKYDVQLATPLKDEQTSQLNYPIIGDYKYDGLRCTAVKEDDKIILLSRSGRELNFPILEEELNQVMEPDTFVDGEIFHKSGFQKLMTCVQRVKGRDEKDIDNNILYFIFDSEKSEILKGVKSTTKQENRKKYIDNIIKPKINDSHHLEVAPWFIVDDVDELQNLFDDSVKKGYEGLMIKDPDAVYECKRTKGWYKMKPRFEEDCEIIGFEEGEGKLNGMLGTLVVRLENGNTTRVGSGLTEDMRKDFWSKRDSLIGKIVEVKYQEKTDQGCLRFPVFGRMRPDKETING